MKVAPIYIALAEFLAGALLFFMVLNRVFVSLPLLTVSVFVLAEGATRVVLEFKDRRTVSVVSCLVAWLVGNTCTLARGARTRAERWARLAKKSRSRNERLKKYLEWEMSTYTMSEPKY